MTVGGILLAAGAGERLGTPKALVRLAGARLVDRGVRLLRDGGCRPVVVVAGAAEVGPVDAEVVRNPRWQDGMASSLAAGLTALEGRAGAAVIALVDQPLVGAEAVRRLIGAWRRGARVAVATYDGRRRNPVLLDREVWPLVREHADGDVGARAFLRARPDLVTEVACDGTGRPDDIDSPEDLARARAATAAAVLFDLDGVLVDSRGPITASINAALDRYGFRTLPEEQLYRFIGPPLPDGFAALIAEQQGDAALVDELCQAYREAYAAVVETETRPVAGMRELVERLAGRKPLGLVTSKGEPFARAILRAVALDGCFSAVAAPSFEAQPEPKAVTLQRGLEELGIAGEEGVLVGDRHHDVAAARALGVTSIGVTWGIGSHDELRGAGADLIADSPSQLGQFLRTGEESVRAERLS